MACEPVRQLAPEVRDGIAGTGQLLRPFGMAPDPVDLRPVRLVGAPGTEEVGNDHPVAGLDQRGDEVAGEGGPPPGAGPPQEPGRGTGGLLHASKPAVRGLRPVRAPRAPRTRT